MNVYRIFALIAIAAIAAPANAQVAPPIEDVVIQGEILNRSVGSTIGEPKGTREVSDTELDGEAGIYILNINEIFSISGNAGLGYTSNPTRTASDPGGDWYGDFGASLGFSTRLGGNVDFGAALNLDGREYFENNLASSRSVSGSMSVGTTILGPVYGGVTGFGGYVFDSDFESGTSFYGVAGNISAALPITQRFLVRPGIGMTQQWSGVSENNSLSAIGSLDILYALSPKWMMSGRASFSKRWYENFYEDVTFVERRDENIGLSAALSWLPTSNLTISASVAYEDQSSSFFLSEFDAIGTVANISLRQRF